MEALIKLIIAHAATPAKWLIVLGMAYTLASTLMFVAAPPETAALQTPLPEARAANATRSDADIANILDANLFGVARPNAAGQATASENLVETRLPLVLHGVFVAENPAESTAILARKGSPEVLYHIGDRVPGNATLVAVHLDHVLLERGRSRERLAFPETGAQLAKPSTAQQNLASPEATRGEGTPNSLAPHRGRLPRPRSIRPKVANPAPAQVAQHYQAQLRNEPVKTLDELGLSPLPGDEPAGYRLDRLARSPYLRQTGLQPGDVILSINGQPVGDVERDRLEIDNVFAQGAARLEVRRGQRHFFITASLDER